ncbi:MULTISPECIES: sensor histidine kinase [Romboutsia]|uniref:histidine kinase n=1 Tax=Romboutsia hominis TaxID=1507512 RepID=A0A2P2BTT7_9FIRM|nr:MULTISPECIES: HAMP domain-containing sensor histidine kinase [Romboutsia]MCH1959733.1 HAMP domain-containing histidine kinase [Romboutsia hominis]MCH1969845.1 HAMP domain-containing histidine kinase [Romboutsia hominis]MDB8803773.1 HAMP domain-containing sensor histidine kinase [Romboutsia sp. 1001216sp1]MDB8806877.1 HAMP domain-containing sensor histidine kinase [Romboutsia sp. 1001216sp1]MDB8809420.1 HAMP domain-containing sensor histidine kinase [Romboutsia sp. 1001216sp1]
MKKIFSKWEKLNIKYKLFTITTGLLLALAIIIYLILYFLLPTYYYEYKIGNFEKSVARLKKESVFYTTDELKEKLHQLEASQNLSVLLTNQSGRRIYGRTELLILNHSKYIINNSREYPKNITIYTKDSILPYNLSIVMPLQPIDEATEVIRNLMPYIIGVAILIAIIGAYIYTKVITKPLIDIIETEREAENKRKEFIATISHELKTPITIISGQLEGMIYNIGKYKDRDLYLEKSYDTTQELKELVNEMIEVSKCEILETDLTLDTVNLSNMVENIIKRQAFLIEDKNLNTVIDIEKDLYVKCDEDRIKKAISNIINNAIKYSPNKETIIVKLYTKSVKIARRKTDSKIYLEVENTGITIDKKYLNEIFKPFFRVEKSRSRKTGGSGLGLYLVSKILQSHGFKHNIKNKENSVIFTIEFN